MSKAYARRAAKNDPKGDRRSRTIDPNPAWTQKPEDLPFAPVPHRLDALNAIYELLMRGDGWLRITCDLDGKNVYLKYKYHRGTHKGYYVMAVVTPDELLRGLQLLVEKTNKVDLGMLSPAKDTAYAD